MLLLAVNPFAFVFTRLAIIEPLLVLVTLLALLSATYIQIPEAHTATARSQRQLASHAIRRNIYPMLALGVLMPVMILTKTTGLFLFPAVAWMLFAAAGYRLLPFLRIALPPAALASRSLARLVPVGGASSLPARLPLPFQR